MGNCENVCLAWPLAQHILTQGWFYNDGTKHNGIDLRAPEGTPVYAAENGTVMNVHQWNGIRTVGDTNSYGNMIKLGHSGEMDTLYAHMSRLLVVQGQQVTKGQQIGVAGNTGNGFGSHLHFEVWSKGKRCNPLCFLDGDFTKANNSVYTYGPGEHAAVAATQLCCISGENPRCEVFEREDISSNIGALALHESCRILEAGSVVSIGGVQGRWYRVEWKGKSAYCLYLPDRCRLE